MAAVVTAFVIGLITGEVITVTLLAFFRAAKEEDKEKIEESEDNKE